MSYTDLVILYLFFQLVSSTYSDRIDHSRRRKSRKK